MTDANTATYDARGFQTRLAGNSRSLTAGSPGRATRRAFYPIPSTRRAANRPSFDPIADRQVREDKAWYVPNFHTEEHFDAHPELHTAADEHANDLHKAERYLDQVYNLVRLLKASFEDDGDSRAMQAETVLNVIENKLDKAQARIDKHDARHTNLFIAYFELKDNPDEDTA